LLTGILQRKCACGQHTGGEGECAECKEKNSKIAERVGINRLASNGNITTQVSHGERYGGHDFSGMTVHSPMINSEVEFVISSMGREPDTETRSVTAQSAGPVLRLEDGVGSPPDAGGGDGGDAGAAGPAPDAGAPPSPLPAGAAPPAPAAAAARAGLPTATFERFVTAGAVRCCRIAGDHGCPTHLGPSIAGDARNQNGMNLVFKIAGHRPSVEYGFVQVMHRSFCTRDAAAAGGAWNVAAANGPGADDSPDPDATCTRPNAANEITMTDAPGFATALGAGGGLPGLDEVSQRMNATDWVIAKERPGKWQRISDLFVWHSVNRNRRNAAGNWELFPGGNEIGRGAVRIGGCPPP
jgi:hypothetical protein